jgi:hypothetical protein
VPPPPPEGFGPTLADGIRHFAEHGFASQEDLDYWLARLRRAAERGMPGETETREHLRRHLGAIYARLIDRGKIAEYVPGVGRYTIAMVRPELRAELDRRIRASADLITLRKAEAVGKTVARFQGWASSIPAGGDTKVNRTEARADIGKSIAQVKFEQRRVAIDQGHKLVANVADIVARQSGAVAAVWHSHWRQAGYDYRKDHKERDQKVYALRGSWAAEKGYMRAGEAGYLDQITQPGQEPFCRCYAQYVTSLRGLPPEMLTQKGRDALKASEAA